MAHQSRNIAFKTRSYKNEFKIDVVKEDFQFQFHSIFDQFIYTQAKYTQLPHSHKHSRHKTMYQSDI